MKKIIALVLVIGASIALVRLVQADEIQFATLPEPIQTTVIHETHITNPSYVAHVVRSANGIYAVTVRKESGEQIVYVNAEGAIVHAPSTTTTTTTVEQPATTARTVQQPADQSVVTYEQVQKNLPRYELVEKKGNKEVYYDRKTGQKVTVKREND